MQATNFKLLSGVRPKQVHAGFTVLEAVIASAMLAMGLAGAMRFSVATLNASQGSRHVDVASGLAQDLTECWGVQTPACQRMFQTKDPLHPIATHPDLAFERTWQVLSIPIADMPPAHLQELRIVVTWQEDLQAMQIEWRHRRASTPLWVGR